VAGGGGGGSNAGTTCGRGGDGGFDFGNAGGDPGNGFGAGGGSQTSVGIDNLYKSLTFAGGGGGYFRGGNGNGGGGGGSNYPADLSPNVYYSRTGCNFGNGSMWVTYDCPPGII